MCHQTPTVSCLCILKLLPLGRQDVDVVVMNAEDFGYDAETIKYELTRANPRFYLVDSRDPHATHRVLWYRLGGPNSTRRCKVDVLVPGLLSIPRIDSSDFLYPENQPAIMLMPFTTLLILKLRGWWDHLNDEARPWMREKVQIAIRC